jgi:hypothetical protein
MMAVRMRQEASKTFENVVDVSRYTEMDVEHSHDTAGVIPQQHGTHSYVRLTDEFV